MNEDRQDFQNIYSNYYPKIVRYLARTVGDAEAEDVAQEVHAALVRFRGESKLSTWVYRIATNAAMDHLRSRAAKQGRNVELGEEGEDPDVAFRDDKPRAGCVPYPQGHERMHSGHC